jgi:hypothetical protein
MATARAIANGNWSATSTWNGGVLPGNGDTIYANGFNVTINQDINIGGANNPTVNAGSFVSGQWYEVLFVGTTSWTGIGAASNTAGTIFLATGVGTGTVNARALATLTTAANTPAGAAAGGSFAMSSPFAITTDLRAGTTTCLSVTGATALTLDGLRVVGSGGAVACNYAGTTTCTLSNATLLGGAGGGASAAMINASTGTVNVTSPCTFTANGGTALNNNSSGTINIASSCTFAGGAANAHGLSNNSTGSVNITASCAFTGGYQAGGGSSVNNASNGTINITASCTFTAANFSSCFALNNASTGTVIVTQGTFTASAFANAVSVANTAADVRLSGDFLDHWSGWKAVSGGKWRLGTSPTLGQTRYALAGTTDSYFTMYGADNGSFGNPIAANVRSGVSYGGGNLTGTCAVPAAGSVALGVAVDNTTGTAVLTPEAVWDYATRSLTTSSGPTAVQIRQEMDSNSTKLANLDATVSSRLAPSGTLATVTTLTNAPTVPTAAAIATQVRSELSVELGRVDASISTRATPASIPTADITAIKAKTDALVTDRLAQVSTVSTTGAQLAAALS